VPRPPNPDLEEQILKAARKLWKKEGATRLPCARLRKRQGPIRPAVYRRFRDREDILRALLQRIRLGICRRAESAPSPEEACERYVDYG